METKNKKIEKVKQPEEVNKQHGMSVKTVVLIVILALVAVVLVFLALPNKQTNLFPKTTKQVVNPADTTLSIEKAMQVSGTTYSSVVSIDTGKNNVNAVQLELVYDPNVVTNVKVTPLNFLTQPVELLNKIDSKNGRISYALGVAPGQERVNGKGNLAKITYTITQSSVSTSFNFLPKTDVAGDQTAASLLKSTSNGVVNIESPTSTSSAY